MGIYIADYLNGLPPEGSELPEVRGALHAVLDPKRGGKPAQLRHVTNRAGLATTYSAGVTAQFSRSWQVSHVPIRKIKVGWANWGVDTANTKGMGAGTEAGPGGTMTIRMSVEYPRGTFTQLTFDNGATSGTIADGATGESDDFDLGFTIPAFRWFRMATHIACAAGTWNINHANGCDRGHGDEFQFGGTDLTMSSTVAGSGTTAAALPLYVLSQSDLGVWGMIGDSILTSLGEDSFPDPSGARGILARALANLGPCVNYGAAGDAAQYFVASHSKRIAALQRAGVTRMIDEYGINDFTIGRTSAQVLADKATIRGYLTGVPWFECTTTPKTTGTFATAAGQTIWSAGGNTQRVTHNNAVRAGIAGAEGFVDIASVVETSTSVESNPTKDGGVWLPYLTGDGTHQTVGCSLRVQPLVANALAACGS